MELKGKTTLVTGGAGFIGSHLVDALLSRGNSVTVLDDFSSGDRANLAGQAGSARLRIIEGDVRNAVAVAAAAAGAQVVFHLATNCVRLSLSDPLTNHEVNATGSLHVLEAARRAGAERFIYCSSSEVYGDIAAHALADGRALLSETSPMLPTTVYGASKLVGEHYALAYHQTYGLPAMVVRPFNSYGPRSHIVGPYGEVIPRFAVLLKAGKSPLIFGDGSQTRDFTYVDDTAAGLIAAAECDRLLGDSVNLAKGQEVSILEITSILKELTGSPAQPQHVDTRPGDIQRLGADTQKARHLLSFNPSISIREGLTRYLAWLEGQAPDYAALAAALTEKNWTEAPVGPR